MAMRLTLEEGQKNNHIANFTIKNRKKATLNLQWKKTSGKIYYYLKMLLINLTMKNHFP